MPSHNKKKLCLNLKGDVNLQVKLKQNHAEEIA